MNLSFTNQQIAVVKRLTSIAFPVFAVTLGVVISLIPDWQAWWLGISRDRFYTDPQYFTWILIGICGGFIGIGTLSWVLGRVWVARYGIQRSMVSFLVAYDRRNWIGLLIIYPLTLLYEELLYRVFGMLICLWIFSFLSPTWQIICSILLNAMIFSIYHLHIYITSKNRALTILYMIVSFFLGVLTAGSVFAIGVIGSWIIHLVIVTTIYLLWARNDFFPSTFAEERQNKEK